MRTQFYQNLLIFTGIIFLFFVGHQKNILNSTWWEKITCHKDGILSFNKRDWYIKAKQIRSGEYFSIDLDNDSDPDLLIEKKRDGTIVMIVDDNDNMSSDIPQGDFSDDCYVVDKNGDGLVDRMIDYIDNDIDGKADEMEIRYYDSGRLRWAWFWEDRDGDGKMWHVKNYEYGKPLQSDMSGDNLFYSNKYNEKEDCWLPFGECPFIFYDPDSDGFSEIAIRFCAAPASSNFGADVDYCNNEEHLWTEIDDSLERMNLVNVRYSFSLKDGNNEKQPFTYDCGLTMLGAEVYAYPHSLYFNPKRRSPKTIVRIDWNFGPRIAENYIAQKTGFSWDEAEVNNRWEGIFWTWERQLIYNTGGSTIKYNIRREFDKDISNKRSLYYSEVDKRIHLFGADEGWIEIGNISEPTSGKLGEIRYFDSDNDGYFDRWEVDLNDDAIPERISTVSEPKAILLNWDYNHLQDFYLKKVLPKAIHENESMINAFRVASILKQSNNKLINSLEKQIENMNDSVRKRYFLDVLRELYYLNVIRFLRNQEKKLYVSPYTARDRYNAEKLSSSVYHWEFAKKITDFEVAYARGDYCEATIILKSLVANIQ